MVSFKKISLPPVEDITSSCRRPGGFPTNCKAGCICGPQHPTWHGGGRGQDRRERRLGAIWRRSGGQSGRVGPGRRRHHQPPQSPREERLQTLQRSWHPTEGRRRRPTRVRSQTSGLRVARAWTEGAGADTEPGREGWQVPREEAGPASHSSAVRVCCRPGQDGQSICCRAAM